jgi:hypothetical protein
MIPLSATLLAASLAGPPLAAEQQPLVGQPAPGFTLPSLAGDTVSLAGFRGKPVVLHFGTGW